MSEWISVKDRLPEEQGYYIDIVYFRGKTKWAKGNERVTHWMPLPELPKGE